MFLFWPNYQLRYIIRSNNIFNRKVYRVFATCIIVHELADIIFGIPSVYFKVVWAFKSKQSV